MNEPIAEVRAAQAEPRTIAVVTAAEGYAGILRVFRQRQAELGLSAEKIDHIVLGEDSENRYATKWLCGHKTLGEKSWGDALGATAMKIVFVEDSHQLEKLKKYLETRDESYVRANARIRVTKWLFNARSGRRAAKRRHAKLSKKQRQDNARALATRRWIALRRRRRKTGQTPKTCQALGDAPNTP